MAESPKPKRTTPNQVERLVGVYIQNSRAIAYNGSLFPITYDMPQTEWQDGQVVKGEICEGVFYPHVEM